MTAHKLMTITYFQTVYNSCRHAVMTAQTLMVFTLNDISKLNTYCDVIPYSDMWRMNVPTRQHADMIVYSERA